MTETMNASTQLPARLDQAAAAVMALCIEHGSLLDGKLRRGEFRLMENDIETPLMRIALGEVSGLYPMSGYAGGADQYLADMLEAHALLAERGFIHVVNGRWLNRASFEDVQRMEQKMWRIGAVYVPAGTRHTHRGEQRETKRQIVKEITPQSAWMGNATVSGRHGHLSWHPGQLHWAGPSGYWCNAPLDGALMDALIEQQSDVQAAA